MTSSSTNRRPHSSEAIFFGLDKILTVMPLGHDRHGACPPLAVMPQLVWLFSASNIGHTSDPTFKPNMVGTYQLSNFITANYCSSLSKRFTQLHCVSVKCQY